MSACPKCLYFDSKVNETKRLVNGWVKRHRRCLVDECQHRWYTLEIPKDQVSAPEDTDMKEIKR